MISPWTPLACPATGCFCEVAQTGIAQPLSVFTSAIFVLAGIVICIMHPRDRWRRVFGVGVIASGVGSMLLHATLTTGGQFADVATLMLTGATLLAWSVARTKRWSNGAIAALLIAVLLIGLMLIPLSPDGRRAWFVLMIVAAMILEIVYQRPPRRRLGMIALSGFVILIGVLLWHFDESTSWCTRWAWYNGHAMWHLGAALGSILYVRALRELPTGSARSTI